MEQTINKRSEGMEFSFIIPDIDESKKRIIEEYHIKRTIFSKFGDYSAFIYPIDYIVGDAVNTEVHISTDGMNDYANYGVLANAIIKLENIMHLSDGFIYKEELGFGINIGRIADVFNKSDIMFIDDEEKSHTFFEWTQAFNASLYDRLVDLDEYQDLVDHYDDLGFDTDDE